MGLGSLLPLLLLSGMRGMGVSPDLIKNIQEEKKQTLEKWKSTIVLLATMIMGWVFFQRAPVTAKDATGSPVYSLEGVQKTNEAMFAESSYASFIKDSVLAAINTVFELLKPSASESLLFSAILTGGQGQTASTTIVQAAPAAPFYAGAPQTFQGLRQTRFASPIRAQGGVVQPDGSVFFE